MSEIYNPKEKEEITQLLTAEFPDLLPIIWKHEVPYESGEREIIDTTPRVCLPPGVNYLYKRDVEKYIADHLPENFAKNHIIRV